MTTPASDLAHRVLALIDHDSPASPAAIAAAFDRAAAVSPEAAVAAWSGGDTARLAAGTAEIVDWLARQDLLGPQRAVLDLGCGFGRIAAALAPRCRCVLALDASGAMIAEARRRLAAPNLRFARIRAGAPPRLPPACLDLVVAVDVFPYFVQAGIAASHIAGAARWLRPGGRLAILNLSYGRDAAADRADVAAWCAAYGLAPLLCGSAPFTVWDGTAFLLARDST